MRFRTHSYASLIAIVALAIGVSGLIVHTTHSQSGRQKNMNAKPAATPAQQRPRQTTKALPPPPAMPQATARSSADDKAPVPDEVVRVSSHLVPVPTTVLDARGAAVTNLRLEDFELVVDGQPKTISDIYRAETPVR